jgi:L-lactate utilization protein LutB
MNTKAHVIARLLASRAGRGFAARNDEDKNVDIQGLQEELRDAAGSGRIRLALARAIKSYRVNTNNALKKFPHTVKMAEDVRVIKENAVQHMAALAKKAGQNIEENKEMYCETAARR